MSEIPAHRKIDIDAVVLLIKRSIAFADWAAGEGICPGQYKDPRKAEKNPDEFLYAYSLETHDEDWPTLADRVAAAFKSLADENGRLKCEINQHAWERDNARRERDVAEDRASALAKALAISLHIMRSYKNMGYGDDVYMSALCEAIRRGEEAYVQEITDTKTGEKVRIGGRHPSKAKQAEETI